MSKNVIWVIMDTVDMDTVDFSRVNQTGVNTVRYNQDRSKFLLSFSGYVPEFIERKVSKYYTTVAIRKILTSF